jgi:hypothetical protein
MNIEEKWTVRPILGIFGGTTNDSGMTAKENKSLARVSEKPPGIFLQEEMALAKAPQTDRLLDPKTCSVTGGDE